ncbi:MAG: hypothetical protein ACRDUW_00230 [Pseudonocardiaceae bacterium]
MVVGRAVLRRVAGRRPWVGHLDGAPDVPAFADGVARAIEPHRAGRVRSWFWRLWVGQVVQACTQM